MTGLRHGSPHWSWWHNILYIYIYGYGSIPIHTIFRGMNIHLPAILMFTRGIGFWPIPILINQLELISGHFRPLWVVTPTFATFFPPFSHLLKKMSGCFGIASHAPAKTSRTASNWSKVLGLYTSHRTLNIPEPIWRTVSHEVSLGGRTISIRKAVWNLILT